MTISGNTLERISRRVLSALLICAGSTTLHAADMTAPTAPVGEDFRPEWIRDDPNSISRTLIYSGRFTSAQVVRELYEENSYRPLWDNKVYSREWMANLQRALDELAWDALPAWRYHTDNIRKLTESGEREAVLDLMITDALVTAVKDLSGQLVPETALGRQWKLRAAPVDAGEIVSQLRRGGMPTLIFDSLRPNHRQYARLRDAYRRHIGTYRETSLEDGIKLKSGDSGPHVLALSERLEAEGLLTLDSERRAAALFDTDLEQAVKAFQRLRGLKADGIVGRATVRALNRSPDSISRTIALNLQRWRTTPRRFPETHVFVNSAAYEMSMYKSGAEVMSMPVVVGKRDRQTPSFSDVMEEVVLNPNWNVPSRITKEELLPKLQEDRSFAKRIGLRALDGNRPVAWDEIDDSQLTRDTFPYRLQQTAGDQNALGRYKFMFPNQHAVYLHDTPYKQLFSESRRAFSHGCVRLQNPAKLANYLLGERGISQQRVEQVVARGERKSYRLHEPLPVYIMYMTAWVDDDGQLAIYPDTYRMDDALDRELVAATEMPDDDDTILALAQQLDQGDAIVR
jgi:murein L,D-transpeptidase YcbB/YkuD